MQPNIATGSYGIQPLASIHVNKMYIYGLNHVYMPIYSHIYLYIQYIYTQMVCKMTFGCIYSEEANAGYTKLTKLWCNNTQLLHRGLHCQTRILATW